MTIETIETIYDLKFDTWNFLICALRI